MSTFPSLNNGIGLTYPVGNVTKNIFTYTFCLIVLNIKI